MSNYKNEKKRLKQVLKYLLIAVTTIATIFIAFIVFIIIWIWNLNSPYVVQVSSRNFASISEEQIFEVLLENLETFGFEKCTQFCPEITVSLEPLQAGIPSQAGIAVDYTAKLLLTNEQGFNIAFINRMWTTRYGYIRLRGIDTDRERADRAIRAAFLDYYDLNIRTVIFTVATYARNEEEYNRALESTRNIILNQIDQIKILLQ